MAKASHYIPLRAHGVTPYLVVDEGRKALDWYRDVFGAEIESVMDGPGGAVMHAELRIGDAQVYLSQEFPGMAGFVSPKTLGGTTTSIHLYVPDVDRTHQAAVEHGAEEIAPPTDQFWGDRHSSILDPFGHRWSVATHVETLSHEELERRAREAAEEFAASTDKS